MQLPMLAAVVLSVVSLASAAEAGASASLRGSRSLSDVMENVTQSKEASSHSAVAGEQQSADSTTLMPVPNQTDLSEGKVSGEDALELHLGSSGGWHQGGDKMWGGGRGIEDINLGNVGYYNEGMYAAHAHCRDTHCALIVNPPGHRTVQHFHIHFVHFKSYGSNLKRSLERMVCSSAGWHGGCPCGGKAAFFPGFPLVFSAAMSEGSIAHASVIAWPASCGGRGTIVQLAYDCSIEHQIRGDYNPRLR